MVVTTYWDGPLPVFSNNCAEDFCDGYGQSHEGDGVEEENAGDVEEQVAQGDLVLISTTSDNCPTKAWTC